MTKLVPEVDFLLASVHLARFERTTFVFGGRFSTEPRG